MPRLAVIPHVFGNSEKLVYDRIGWLCSQELNYGKKDLEEFSYTLGIVMHCLSDFFCRAHNGRLRFINFISHRRYEKKLKNYFEKNINQFINLKNAIDWRESIDDMKSFLPNKVEQYRNSRKSLSLDMDFSIRVSVTVALKIVSRCIENRFDAVRKAA